MMVSSTNQIQAKRKKKFTGGNASKRHRDRVNIEFNNLAKLLPFPENVIAKLDKSSILRLAVSYIRAKSFFKDALPVDQEGLLNGKRDSQNRNEIYKGLLEETCLTEFFLQALDGFLIVITEDLKVLYVSESVRDYLGYCQAGIIHESFLQFIHWADEDSVKKVLKFDASTNGLIENDIKQGKKINQRDSAEVLNGICGDSNSNSRVQSHRFVCRMKCAFSCSSRFYTAFQAFQFSGHVRRSTIQEGKEQRTLNTLIAFGSPSANSRFDPAELVSDTYDETRSCPEDEPNGPNVKMVGLHIEPRLRPHIAPIPIPQSETDGRMVNQTQPYSYNRHFGLNGRIDPSCSAGLDARIGSTYPRIINDYYREGPVRYTNGWVPRSSSLSNSPISDASSPRGIKRSASADASPENCDVINGRKQPRYDGQIFSKNQNGYNCPPSDDIHSSAKILMQLKETQKKLVDKFYSTNDSESDSSCDDRSERGGHIQWEHDVSTEDQRGIPRFLIDRKQYPENNGRTYYGSNGFLHGTSRRFSDSLSASAHELALRKRSEGIRGVDGENLFRRSSARDEIAEEILQSKFLPSRFTNLRSFSSEPFQATDSSSKDSKSFITSRIASMNGVSSKNASSPSRLSPPKRDLNKGFHISTILGLKDEAGKDRVAGQLMRDSLNKNVQEEATQTELQGEAEQSEGEKVVISKHVANIDDVKSSFAQVLQVFTATITRTIDTILKP